MRRLHVPAWIAAAPPTANVFAPIRRSRYRDAVPQVEDPEPRSAVGIARFRATLHVE